MAEWSDCNRDHLVCKAKNIHKLALYRESLPAPEVDCELHEVVLTSSISVHPHLSTRWPPKHGVGEGMSKHVADLNG